MERRHPAHCSRHTVAYLRSHVLEFIELDNWPPNSLDIILWIIQYVGALQQMMMLSQNFRHLSAEMHADRLLGSAKPGHDALNQAIDQLPKN